MFNTLGALLALLLAAGGQDESHDRAMAELKPAVEKADKVFAELRQALLTRLTAELTQGGALTALSACHDAAPEITRRVLITEGIEVGRTSHRLRNIHNRPPEWAADHVADAAGRPAADVQPLIVDLGDRVGVLRPIPTLAMCTTCHGPDDRISPDIQETLTALYPDDRATGFSEGDLRGWMWAEVPKPR